jgi:hypothetical protein
MKNEFENTVESYFADIITDYAVVKQESVYDPDSFGNALVSYMAADFGFRLIKDRGQIFLEFCSARSIDDWLDFIETIKAVKKEGETLPQYDYCVGDMEPQRQKNQIRHIAAAVKPHLASIVAYLRDR